MTEYLTVRSLTMLATRLPSCHLVYSYGTLSSVGPQLKQTNASDHFLVYWVIHMTPVCMSLRSSIGAGVGVVTPLFVSTASVVISVLNLLIEVLVLIFAEIIWFGSIRRSIGSNTIDCYPFRIGLQVRIPVMITNSLSNPMSANRASLNAKKKITASYEWRWDSAVLKPTLCDALLQAVNQQVQCL
jgi:hypothetical protein